MNMSLLELPDTVSPLDSAATSETPPAVPEILIGSLVGGTANNVDGGIVNFFKHDVCEVTYC